MDKKAFRWDRVVKLVYILPVNIGIFNRKSFSIVQTIDSPNLSSLRSLMQPRKL